MKKKLCFLSDEHLPSMCEVLAQSPALSPQNRKKGRGRGTSLNTGRELRVLHMLGKCYPFIYTTTLEIHRPNLRNCFQNEGRMETCFLGEGKGSNHPMSMSLLRKSDTLPSFTSSSTLIVHFLVPYLPK